MSTRVRPFFVSFKSENFVRMPLNTIQMSVMPVVVLRKDSMTCAGSAFAIANFGLMLTARHVLEYALELRERDDDAHVAVLYVATGIGKQVPDLLGGALPIWRAEMSNDTDLALLQVQLPLIDGRPIRFPALELTTSIPALGDSTMSLGYSRVKARELRHAEDESAFEVIQDFNASRGTVSRVYPSGRDRVMLPGPSFETTAQADLGMSGGPVLNARSGKVSGVVGSAIRDGHGDLSWPTYALLIEPVLNLRVLGRDEAESETTLPVIELARRGYVSISAAD